MKRQPPEWARYLMTAGTLGLCLCALRLAGWHTATSFLSGTVEQGACDWTRQVMRGSLYITLHLVFWIFAPPMAAMGLLSAWLGKRRPVETPKRATVDGPVDQS